MLLPSPLPTLIGVLVMSVWLLSAADAGPRSVDLSGQTMGTTWKATLVVPEEVSPQQLDALRGRIDARFNGIEDSMSTWRPASEISRFNRSRQTDWVPVQPDFVRVLSVAHKVSAATNGAFDVTVGPLIRLWGFDAERQQRLIPLPSDVQTAMKRIGWRSLSSRADPPSIRKRLPELEVNLSAVAKGYGVDAISRLLHGEGWERHLVEVGGEVRARGLNARNRPWRVGVERPYGGVAALVGLTFEGMATSGDYRQAFDADGRRYSHIIDPTTGEPVENTVASATVVAETCAKADAWATAMMVLGQETGMETAEREGLAVMMIVRDPDGRFRTLTNSKFDALQTG